MKPRWPGSRWNTTDLSILNLEKPLCNVTSITATWGGPVHPVANFKWPSRPKRAVLERRSDGTIGLKGIRFEIPSRYHHFQRLSVRAAFWDLSQVHLADPKTGAILCRLFPLDKRKNAQGERAAKGSALVRPTAAVSPVLSSMAPLLQKLIQQYAITGLPPAYLPQQQSNTDPHRS